MKHEDLTHKIIGCAYTVYNSLGFGFLESVYKKAMIIELNKVNLKVEEEKSLDVLYDGQVIGKFFADLYIEIDGFSSRPRGRDWGFPVSSGNRKRTT